MRVEVLWPWLRLLTLAREGRPWPVSPELVAQQEMSVRPAEELGAQRSAGRGRVPRGIRHTGEAPGVVGNPSQPRGLLLQGQLPTARTTGRSVACEHSLRITLRAAASTGARGWPGRRGSASATS